MKKVNITNNFMVDSVTAINKCAAFASGKTAFAMLKARETFQKELVPFEEARKALFEKYGKTNEDGSIVVEANSENYKVFREEMLELLNIAFDVELFSIKEDEFNLKFEGDTTLYDYDLIHALIVE